MQPKATIPDLPPLKGAALPLKDALRGMRHAMRTSRKLLDPARGRLPGPLDQVARDLLSQVDHIAADVERLSSDAAHRILDLEDGDHALPHLAARKDGEILFAQAAYHGLTYALDRLGADDLMVSETLAADAYRDAARGQPEGAAHAHQAAALMDALLARGVIGAPPGLRTGSDAARDETVLTALFSLMLWMLADRSVPGEDEDALLATCCDVAHAIRPEIAGTGGRRDAVARLLDDYARTI